MLPKGMFLAFVALFLVSCSLPAPTVVAQVTPAPVEATPTATPLLAAALATAAPTRLTPTAAATLTPAPTPTAARTPTATPEPRRLATGTPIAQTVLLDGHGELSI